MQNPTVVEELIAYAFGLDFDASNKAFDNIAALFISYQLSVRELRDDWPDDLFG